MNIERLTQLYHFVKAAPPERFNMNNWLTFKGDKYPKLDEIIENVYNQPECGTVACLAGHAIILFAGNKQRQEISNVARVAQCFLDLTSNEREQLFSYRSRSGGYCSRNEALSRLQTLIEKNGGTISEAP